MLLPKNSKDEGKNYYQSFLDCTAPFSVGVHSETPDPAADNLVANTGMKSEIFNRYVNCFY